MQKQNLRSEKLSTLFDVLLLYLSLKYEAANDVSLLLSIIQMIRSGSIAAVQDFGLNFFGLITMVAVCVSIVFIFIKVLCALFAEMDE